jgi:hypothetical protein
VVTNTSSAIRGLQISTRSAVKLRVAVIVTLIIKFFIIIVISVVAD